jgi:hypothetical protein
MTENNWSKVKVNFQFGFAISFILFIYSILENQVYYSKELLSIDGQFKSAKDFGRKKTIIEIKLINNNISYKICWVEKIHLNGILLKKIKYGDHIEILHVDNNVLQMKYKNLNLINKAESDKHKKQNRKYSLTLTLFSSIYFLIPLFLRKQPSFKIFGKVYFLKLDLITIGILILSLTLITYLTGGTYKIN